ncbi:MAG TPA: acetyltransferase [Alphaproteobacteria bacterium]|nr:acetyltransferase [Alphaproteobacteria bacterium]
MTRVWIYGSGGHAKVVIDAAEQAGLLIAGVVDDAPEKWGTRLFGYGIIGGLEALLKTRSEGDHAFVAIGDNQARQQIANRLDAFGIRLITIVHPSARVGRAVHLADGCILMPGAIVNADSRIGRGVIVNTAASVDHDCCLGRYVHLSPGARLGGHVQIGDRTWVGINASIIPGCRIGADCIVGAGAVVVRDVADDTTVVGVPAKPLVKTERQLR